MCPYLQLRKSPDLLQGVSIAEADDPPAVVFWNPAYAPAWLAGFLHRHVVICVADSNQYIEDAARQRAIGYLLEPFEDDKLANAVGVAQAVLLEYETQRLLKEFLKKGKAPCLVGIPTLDGTEIMSADEIVRCEARVRCTIVVTKKGNIISAYNIGEFRKMLCPMGGFFATHRAHIVNLTYVRRLNRSRTVEMHDGHEVPITQENKVRFLEMINSIR
ncbi:MAG TPA: LytTR family DNA-binding domain-containing protein [Flavilitoribacter sp.]|nr:LytTR family DNA-binding domain-containing protein [Flavilitoribacter sp.]